MEWGYSHSSTVTNTMRLLHCLRMIICSIVYNGEIVCQSVVVRTGSYPIMNYDTDTEDAEYDLNVCKYERWLYLLKDKFTWVQQMVNLLRLSWGVISSQHREFGISFHSVWSQTVDGYMNIFVPSILHCILDFIWWNQVYLNSVATHALLRQKDWKLWLIDQVTWPNIYNGIVYG